MKDSEIMDQGSRDAKPKVSVQGLLDALFHDLAWAIVLFNLMACFATLHWTFDLATHFPIHYLTGSVLAILIFPFLRDARSRPATRVLFLLMFLTAFLNASLILGLYWKPKVRGPVMKAAEAAPAPVPESREPRFLRILSLNVHTSNDRADKVIRVIRANRPQVVMLQEVDQQWLDRLKPLNEIYPFMKAVPRDDNFGIALFSKIPFKGASTLIFDDLASVPTIQAEIEGLTMLATHVLPPVNGEYARSRNEHFKKMALHVKALQGPALVAGDLNCTTFSPFFQRLLEDSGLENSGAGLGYQPTWPANVPFVPRFLMIPIDHILISRGIEVQKRWIDSETGSDHLPLLMDINY